MAATLFFTLLSPGSTLPLVGASGAISGVLGFYFLWFPLNVVRVLVFLFPILMRVFEIPARIVLGVYLVWDNILPLIITAGQGGGGVAHGAHIGGFVAGLAGAWVIDRVTTTARPPEYASAPEVMPAASAIEAAIARGDMEAAARAYFTAAEPDPLSPAATLALANWLATHGHGDAALIVYRRFIRDHGREPGAAEAQLGAGLVELRRGQLAPAYQHLRASLERDPAPGTRVRAMEALREIADQQKYPMQRFEGRR